MPTKKDGIVIKEEERFKVIIHDNGNFEDYHFLLTHDQIKLLDELVCMEFIEDVTISVIKPNTEWRKI